MTLNKKNITTCKIQPSNAEVDVEACHENTQDNWHSQIAERAYYKAEARGFEPGRELDDWIEAESEFEKIY